MSEDKPLRDKLGLPSASNAAGTVVRLGVACLVVGALLAILNIDPIRLWQDIVSWIKHGLVDLFGTGLEGVSLVLTLLATGAIIVIPIWVISKLLSLGKR